MRSVRAVGRLQGLERRRKALRFGKHLFVGKPPDMLLEIAGFQPFTEHERLFALLPYKTLYLSSVKDRHGVFAFISKDERRDLPLRKQRPSVRAQLKEGQSKKIAAPKKAAAKTKDNDLEV